MTLVGDWEVVVVRVKRSDPTPIYNVLCVAVPVSFPAAACLPSLPTRIVPAVP